LHYNRAQDDSEEEEIVEETVEDIVLLGSDLPGIDLIEDLHEDEGVEDQTEVLGFLSGGEGTVDRINDEEWDIGIVGIAEHLFAAKKQHKQDCDLEDSLPHNVSPHD
jgi:hypothetical protein